MTKIVVADTAAASSTQIIDEVRHGDIETIDLNYRKIIMLQGGKTWKLGKLLFNLRQLVGFFFGKTLCNIREPIFNLLSVTHHIQYTPQDLFAFVDSIVFNRCTNRHTIFVFPSIRTLIPRYVSNWLIFIPNSMNSCIGMLPIFTKGNPSRKPSFHTRTIMAPSEVNGVRMTG